MMECRCKKKLKYPPSGKAGRGNQEPKPRQESIPRKTKFFSTEQDKSKKLVLETQN
jgi:hypothetical protein